MQSRKVPSAPPEYLLDATIPPEYDSPPPYEQCVSQPPAHQPSTQQPSQQPTSGMVRNFLYSTATWVGNALMKNSNNE